MGNETAWQEAAITGRFAGKTGSVVNVASQAGLLGSAADNLGYRILRQAPRR